MLTPVCSRASLSPTTTPRVVSADGIQRISSTVYNPTFGAPFSPGATPILNQRQFAPHISAPLYSTYNLGGSRKLPFGFTLAADLGSGRTWNQFRSNNVNAPLTSSPTGPRPLAPNVNILQVQNSGQGHIDFEYIGIENHALKRLQFFAGTVHISQIDDFDDNTFFTPQASRSDAGEFARRGDEGAWQALGNFSLQLPRNVQLSGDFYGSGDQPFNITTGFDNNGDGNFNDRPQVAAASTPGAVQTPYGLLTSGRGIAILGRNRGLLPWTVHLDANLQRAFKLTRNPKAEHPQTVTANLRSSKFLNHTNVTGVGSVLGSPLFNRPYAAGPGRRVEAGIRYTF